ncbi:3,4-dihydroxy-2-butanone-4-phosphate synthase [Hypericibacter adhaerens]|jgi:3,4-dihydroxy 2-butanone 4-phosphate synthase/GTP cyclohydrolase II|uniref:3,4-dihydroxy-2-butanone 4-phosphate synthase n=3 Tax=Hypericibacter adhaerens TaxID=2602016 RepID=A0A5J6MZX4_9PROT|nr:3,4-dihydroxy-2-butanone-4-phosphate synthase [Hypericibacter adhaerens]QEX22717.1 3,4-dihydroxy-2-butanone-4-phosphate synthase [Hypericibacter adhaerens]
MSQPKLEPWRATFSDLVSPTESIIEEARNGRMFVLVDDESRENEGDLVIPAQMATPDAINFMAKYGRGLICLALTGERVEHLGLPLMAQHNGTRHQTAFTVSIEAREGVTTGISAPDRARTIATAIDPSKTRADIVTPGHVFPLQARDGGVLVRAGHTEAAVDLARLAGLNPSGVICEIMNDDGTMARRDDLIAFAQRHALKIGTIADLIAYRRRHDRIVERSIETEFESRYGGKFQMIVYVNRVAYAEHIALVKGDLSAPGPIPVRMHALNVLDDVLGDTTGGRGGQLQAAMQMIADHGRGVVVMIREPHPTSLSERVLAHHNQKSESTGQLRDYGVGAQILIDLGVREMILISNTHRTIVGLEGYGLTVVDQWPIPPAR